MEGQDLEIDSQTDEKQVRDGWTGGKEREQDGGK